MQQLQYLAWLGAMSWDDYDSLSSDVTGSLVLFFLYHLLPSFAILRRPLPPLLSELYLTSFTCAVQLLKPTSQDIYKLQTD